MRTKLLTVAVALLAFSLLSASPLLADSLTEYTYKAGGNTFTWELPTKPTPTSDNAFPGSAFTIPNLTFTENGVSMVGTIDFWNRSSSGGFDLYTGAFNFLADTIGPQLYFGSEGSPTLKPGIFPVLDFGNGNTLMLGMLQAKTVSEVVPEPPSLALMAVGLAMVLASALLRKN